MKQRLWILAGITALAACSNGRERRVAMSEAERERPDLTLPDTIVRQDTSVSRSSSEQPVSPVEQQVARADSTPARVSKPVRSRRPRPATTVATQPAPDTSVRGDSSVQGYAPTPAPETTVGETVAADTTRDTVLADTAGSVATVPSDTGAPPVDTARAAISPPDTTSTPKPDPTVAPKPASSTASAARTLPVGTEIHAALDDSITSRRDTVGRQVSAHVMQNVVGPDGKTLIAAGTPVRLTIERLRPARSKSSQGRFALRADGIAFDGQLQPVRAELRPVPRELRGRGVTGSEAAKVGGGAAAGAVLGQVIGGNTRGAVIGGVAGAAAGAVVASQTATRDVVVKAKTPLVLVLTAPLVVP
jgi:hypothetical protein